MCLGLKWQVRRNLFPPASLFLLDRDVSKPDPGPVNKHVNPSLKPHCLSASARGGNAPPDLPVTTAELRYIGLRACSPSKPWLAHMQLQLPTLLTPQSKCRCRTQVRACPPTKSALPAYAYSCTHASSGDAICMQAHASQTMPLATQRLRTNPAHISRCTRAACALPTSPHSMLPAQQSRPAQAPKPSHPRPP